MLILKRVNIIDSSKRNLHIICGNKSGKSNQFSSFSLIFNFIDDLQFSMNWGDAFYPFQSSFWWKNADFRKTQRKCNVMYTFLDLLSVRYNFAKFHHCEICGKLVLGPLIISYSRIAPKRLILIRVNTTVSSEMNLHIMHFITTNQARTIDILSSFSLIFNSTDELMKCNFQWTGVVRSIHSNLIFGEKMLMSAEIKGCIKWLIRFLYLL